MAAKPKSTGPEEEALLFLLQHPLRRRLLKLCVEAKGTCSPKELMVAVNRDISIVGYHVRVLAEHGALTLVESKARRGAVEHFYKATSLVENVPWGRAALGLRPG